MLSTHYFIQWIGVEFFMGIKLTIHRPCSRYDVNSEWSYTSTRLCASVAERKIYNL